MHKIHYQVMLVNGKLIDIWADRVIMVRDGNTGELNRLLFEGILQDEKRRMMYLNPRAVAAVWTLEDEDD